MQPSRAVTQLTLTDLAYPPIQILRILTCKSNIDKSEIIEEETEAIESSSKGLRIPRRRCCEIVSASDGVMLRNEDRDVSGVGR